MSLERGTARAFGGYIRHHLERVEAANEETLDRVAEEMFQVVSNDSMILLGGTGHSIAMVLEGFYRAGGLACVRPLYHPSLLPLHGGQASTLFEHTSGVAELVVDRAVPHPSDLSFIFSNSGVNVVPVELAEQLQKRGTPVVAVVSLTHLRAAPKRAVHKLDEVADHVLDTMVPYGDSVYPAGGATTAGLSSITCIYLWNLLLVRLADIAHAAGTELPIWTSSNVEGGAERNAELFARYRGVAEL